MAGTFVWYSLVFEEQQHRGIIELNGIRRFALCTTTTHNTQLNFVWQTRRIHNFVYKRA